MFVYCEMFDNACTAQFAFVLSLKLTSLMGGLVSLGSIKILKKSCALFDFAYFLGPETSY